MDNEVIDQNNSITIYRIVQELINNTMKHAAAKMPLYPSQSQIAHLSVTVEDDGKGFDTVILQRAKRNWLGKYSKQGGLFKGHNGCAIYRRQKEHLFT